MAEPLIAVASTKYELGHDAQLWELQPGEVPPYTVTTLSRGLMIEHATDAHFALAVVHKSGRPLSWQPRLTKDALSAVREHGYEVRLGLYVADVDTPGHVPITLARIDDARARLAALTTIGWYTSRAGIRVIQPLARGLTPEEYEHSLGTWLAQLQHVLGNGWVVDPRCADWTRHFRLPSVRRDGRVTTSVMDIDRMTAIDVPPIVLPPPRPPVVYQPRGRASDPADVLDRARRYLDAMPPAISGQGGHAATFRAACVLCVGFDLGELDALALLREFNQRCQPPWTERELGHKVADALKADGERGHLLRPRSIPVSIDLDNPPPGIAIDGYDDVQEYTPEPISAPSEPAASSARTTRNLTDLGNAERLRDQHGQDIRYVTSWRTWIIWDGSRWAIDMTDRIRTMAAATVRGIYREVAAESDAAKRKALAAWAKQSESAARIQAMITLAGALPKMAIAPAELDAQPWLLNCANGTIDLQTGALRPANRADLITKCTRVAFDADAKCPTYDRFLEQAQPDAAIRRLLDQLDGYSLTGIVRDHIFPCHWGKGRNGKGTYEETQLAIVGDYGVKVPVESLTARRGGSSHPTERMVYFGMRRALASETEQNAVLSVALVKELTGGDRISGRRMGEDYWSYAPTHKLRLMTNNKPAIREASNAIWSRVLLIPWLVSFADKPDTSLPEKLRKEASGILARAVRGCLDWQANGLVVPDAVRAATNLYREDSDVLGKFVDEACDIGDQYSVSAKVLFRAFREWAEDGSEYEMSQTLFGRQLSDRGYVKVKSGTVTWHGLRVRDPGANGLAVDDIHEPEDNPLLEELV